MRKNNGVLTGKIFVLILLADLLQSFAEIYFKKGAAAVGIDALTVHNVFVFTGQVLGKLNIWVGIFLFLANFLLWIIVLSKIDLSVAYPVGSAPYIIVPVLSLIFLQERISWMRWGGIALIALGMYLIATSTRLNKDQS